MKRGVVKISNHLKQCHTLTPQQHAEALKSARVVASKKPTARATPLLKGQTSLLSFSQDPLPDPHTDYKELISKKDGTRPFPSFPDSQLTDFKTWLMSAEGKLRDEREATQITREVGKVLKYLRPVLSWDSLLDAEGINKYLEVAEEAGVGYAGLVTKCDRIITALTFLHLTKTKSTQSSRVSEIQTLKQRITTWKQSFYKKKALKRAMKESSPDVLHPTAVTAITSHTPMWEDFERILKDARKKRVVSQDDLTLCTAMVAATLLIESCQRPSAVTGVTVEEYNRCTNEDGVVVIKVLSHKTMRHGPAMLTITPVHKHKIDMYVRFIRPLMDPFGKSKKLVVLPGDKEVVVNRLLRKLSTRYQVEVPTATKVRKAISTAATSECSEQEIATLSKQLSHSMSTHKRYYEQTKAKKGAAEAYKITQSLKTSAVPSKPQRRRFTEAEVTQIEAFFQTEIEAGKKATLQRCREFLQVNPMDRTPKHIQDKVANIIKFNS